MARDTDYDEPDRPTCQICGGMLVPLGDLGVRTWSRCRHCGAEFSSIEDQAERDDFNEEEDDDPTLVY